MAERKARRRPRPRRTSRGTARGARRAAPRKDRLIQTRVPRELERTLKEEARRQRLTVSHLIRNLLEDAFQLVDGVVADVDQIVSDSVTLAQNVRRGARRLASSARGREREAAPDLSGVDAWNEVVLNRPARCAACGAAMRRGDRGFAGIGRGLQVRRWLCARCMG